MVRGWAQLGERRFPRLGAHPAAQHDGVEIGLAEPVREVLDVGGPLAQQEAVPPAL